jgi:hypothetical protein
MPTVRLSCVSVLLSVLAVLTGCQLPVRTKAEARQHQLGEPFIVEADFMAIARRWDELAVKPVKLGAVLDVSANTRLQIFESLGVAEIIEGTEGMISAMVELRRIGPNRTQVTVFKPATSPGGPLPGWIELIRSTPTS